MNQFYIKSQFSPMLEINKIISNLILDDFDVGKTASLSVRPLYCLTLPFVGVHIFRSSFIPLNRMLKFGVDFFYILQRCALIPKPKIFGFGF